MVEDDLLKSNIKLENLRKCNVDADQKKNDRTNELENLKQDASEYALFSENNLTENNKMHNNNQTNHNIV